MYVFKSIIIMMEGYVTRNYFLSMCAFARGKRQKVTRT